MSTAATEGLPAAPTPQSSVLAVLQRIGRSLMLPIAVLPAAALLLRFGQPDLLVKVWSHFSILATAGNALLSNRFYRIKLPNWLAFFGGRRFVPIVTAVAALILGVIFGYIWTPIGHGINNLGDLLTTHGAVGAGIYGMLNRLLLPFGLHHIVNSLVWFTFGTYNGVHGDLNRYFAGDPTAGTFMAGFFPVMMFGVVYAVVYYVVFDFLIKRLNLQTPGREPDTAAVEEPAPAAARPEESPA